MKNQVKNLLKGQEVKRVEKEKGFAVERRSLGEKLVAELNEALVELGCEDLLVKGETVVNNIEIKKGKVVEVVKEVEVIKEVNNNEILVKAIEAKDRYIKELETKLQDKAYIAANDGFVVDGVEVSVKVVNELNDKITELEEELAKLERATNAMDYKIVELTNEKDLAEKELVECHNIMTKLEKERDAYKKSSESFQSKYTKVKNERAKLQEEIAELEADAINLTPVVEEKKEVEPVEDKVVVAAKLVKLEKYKSERRDDVAFYDNGEFYVMASNTCQEITVIPKKITTKVTEDIVNSIQEELVNIGYRREREVVSPVVVNVDKGNLKGYFARTDARAGIMNFSKDDFFGGYVVDGSRAYLWSWDGKSELCATYYLDKVIVGDKKKSVTTGTAKMVSKLVKEMHREYLKRVDALQLAKQEEIAKNTAAVNAAKAAMDAHNAMFEQGIEYTAPVQEGPKNETPVNEGFDPNQFTKETNKFIDIF